MLEGEVSCGAGVVALPSQPGMRKEVGAKVHSSRQKPDTVDTRQRQAKLHSTV